MPAPSVPRIRCNLFGGIGSTATWMTSWWTQPDAPPLDQAGIQAMAVALGTAASTMWSLSLKKFNDSSTYMDHVSVQYYLGGTNSVAMEGAVTGLVNAGTGADGGAISQCVVVSLKTDLIGRSGRGRMFMPATGALGTGTSAHSFVGTDCNDLRSGVAQMMKTMRDTGGGLSGPLTPVVQSERLGQVNPVVTVKVDARPDRQERREAGTSFYSVFGPL